MEDACESLEPRYVDETYNQFNIGIKEDDDEKEDLDYLDDSPKKSSSRNPPFEINVIFDQYRRNRDYKGYLYLGLEYTIYYLTFIPLYYMYGHIIFRF